MCLRFFKGFYLDLSGLVFGPGKSSLQILSREKCCPGFGAFAGPLGCVTGTAITLFILSVLALHGLGLGPGRPGTVGQVGLAGNGVTLAE